MTEPLNHPEEHLEKVIQNAVCQRFDPDPCAENAICREQQWQRLRERIAAGRRQYLFRIGPWNFEKLHAAAMAAAFLLLISTLFFTGQLQQINWKSAIFLANNEQQEGFQSFPLDNDSNSGKGVGPQAPPEELEVAGDADAGDSGNEPPSRTDSRESSLAGAAIDNQTTSAEQTLMFEELIHRVPFNILYPGYLPQGFQLANINYESHSNNTGKLILYFEHRDGRYLRLEQEKFASFSNRDHVYPESGSFTTVRGYGAHIISRNQNYSELYWVEDNNVFRMWGQVATAEITSVAESLTQNF